MEYPDPAEETNTALEACSICGRTFRPDALARHYKVCEKNATKKRKVFDSSKQRAAEDAQQVVVKNPVVKKKPTKAKAEEVKPKPKPKTNWREKHEELIDTIKKARGQDVEKPKTGEKEEPKKKVPSDYVQCPACARYFNQRAAERHISWCKQKQSTTPKAPSTDEAKEKLIARVKYRPPQGKSRLLQRNTKTTSAVPVSDTKKQLLNREQGSHSSPPKFLDNRNAKNNKLDRINNNVTQRSPNLKKRSGSRSREREVVSQPVLPQHIIKFKERFPNHINKKNSDLEESLTSEQLRELLSCSRITDRCPKTVPGVRLSGSGGQITHRNNHNNDNWSYRSSDVSRSSSSSGGSSNSWNKRLTDSSTLPEVSSSELPGTWMSKLCWNGDLDNSMNSNSSGSSSNGSLPPLSRESHEEIIPLTFYCHQCNSKFPLIGAKYCCECGAKRRGLGQISMNQTG